MPCPKEKGLGTKEGKVGSPQREHHWATLSMIISFNPYNDLGEMNHYPHFTEQKTKFREGR